MAVTRTRRQFPPASATLVVDRADEESLRRVIVSLKPNIVLDLACYAPCETEAMTRIFDGDRYILVSSSAVYPDMHGRLAQEDDFLALRGDIPPGRPQSYADGKRWCETVLARCRNWFPATVVRPPAVFGVGDPTLRMIAYLERVNDGGPLLVPEETYRRPAGLAWVRDVAVACASACELDRPVTGIAFNVAFDGVSLQTLIEEIGSALGQHPSLIPVPFRDLPPEASPYGPDPARPAGFRIDRARRALGWHPSPFPTALADTVKWYRASGPSHPGYRARPYEREIAGRYSSRT